MAGTEVPPRLVVHGECHGQPHYKGSSAGSHNRAQDPELPQCYEEVEAEVPILQIGTRATQERWCLGRAPQLHGRVAASR